MKRKDDSHRDVLSAKGGAYTEMSELIRLRHAAKEIPALRLNKSQNPLAGMLTSNFKGRGIDFAEVRQYEPGDDVRTIDWRVTARTQEPHTKLFQEERERPVMFLVDQSSSMFFGSRVRFKSVLAAEIAAVLAWSCLNHGDRVGGMVFDNNEHREVRPRRNKHSLLRLLYELHEFNHRLNRDSFRERQSNLADAILNVRRIAKHGYTVILISDFQQFSESAALHLTQLSQHNDVLGVMVADPMETHLPMPDLYTITNGEERVEINTASDKHRAAFASSYQSRTQVISQHFARLRAPLLTLTTSDDVVPKLVSALTQPISNQGKRTGLNSEQGTSAATEQDR